MIKTRRCKCCESQYESKKAGAKFCSRLCANIKELPRRRFSSNIDRSGGPNGCNVWLGHKMDTGYGRMKVGDRRHFVHRVSFELSFGPIPGDLMVLHSCDNPSCVNSLHLFLGTSKDNSRDMVRKDRQARGERSPHSKLNRKQAVEIFLLRGKKSQRRLAREYGVTQSAIGAIQRKRTWKSATKGL